MKQSTWFALIGSLGIISAVTWSSLSVIQDAPPLLVQTLQEVSEYHPQLVHALTDWQEQHSVIPYFQLSDLRQEEAVALTHVPSLLTESTTGERTLEVWQDLLQLTFGTRDDGQARAIIQAVQQAWHITLTLTEAEYEARAYEQDEGVYKEWDTLLFNTAIMYFIPTVTITFTAQIQSQEQLVPIHSYRVSAYLLRASDVTAKSSRVLFEQAEEIKNQSK